MAALRTTTKDRIAAVEPVVRRVLAPRVHDSDRLDDLVQETLSRVAATRRDLGGDTLTAYAIVAARNVWATDSARSARRDALEHRLADTRRPEQPETLTMAGEEEDALRKALASLSDAERRALLAHELEGVKTATLAEETRSTPGAVAAGLSRTRAKLRVDYLLAYRRVELPGEHCRSVLVALSAGDRRRQSTLGAADHVLSCPVCADLAPALVERRLALAALVPAVGVARVFRWVRRGAKDHPGPAAAGTAAVAAVAAAVFLLPDPEPGPAPPPQLCPGLVAADGRPVAAPGGSGAGLVGTAVDGRALPVQSVPANEGFWLSCGTSRLWVRLVGPGESPRAISPGGTVGFRGVLAGHGPGFAASQGVEPDEGGAELDARGLHVEVAYPDLGG